MGKRTLVIWNLVVKPKRRCRDNYGRSPWEAKKVHRSKLQHIARMTLLYIHTVLEALIAPNHGQRFRLATRSCNKLLLKPSDPAWNGLQT